MFKQFFNAHAQFVAVKRLGKIGIGTRFQALHAVGFGYLCRNNDDGDVARYIVSPNSSAHFQPVYARHHQVGNNHIGHHFFGFVQPVVSVVGVNDGVFVRQLRADKGSHVHIVVDNQHA